MHRAFRVCKPPRSTRAAASDTHPTLDDSKGRVELPSHVHVSLALNAADIHELHALAKATGVGHVSKGPAYTPSRWVVRKSAEVAHVLAWLEARAGVLTAGRLHLLAAACYARLAALGWTDASTPEVACLRQCITSRAVQPYYHVALVLLVLYRLLRGAYPAAVLGCEAPGAGTAVR